MPDIDKNYYLDREGIDTLATEVKSKIADAAKTVKQSATSTNADYEVLFSQSANNTTTTEEVGKNSNLTFNPSTGNLQASNITVAGYNLSLSPPNSLSDDSADIVWYYGNGQEKARLWTDNTYTTKSGLNYRVYKSDGTSLYSGTLPLTDGTGASGTWGINISGNATNASTILKQDRISDSATLDAFTNGNLRYAPVGNNVAGSYTDGFVVTVPFSDLYGHQIYIDDNNPTIAHRALNNGTWGNWRICLDEGNYSSYALPLTGGTITGVVKFKGSAASQLLQSRSLVGLNTDATAQDALYLQHANTTDDTVYFGATAGGNISSNGTLYSGTSESSNTISYQEELNTADALDSFYSVNNFKSAVWRNWSSADIAKASYPGVTNGIILSGGYLAANYGYQIAIDDDPGHYIALRQRNANGWSAWKRLVVNDDTTTGTGGAWKISITGSAGSAPASDVYSWAKASTKPSYNFSEIGTGIATIGDGANAIKWRTNGAWTSGVYYHTTGDESVVFSNKNTRASWIFAYTDLDERTAWTSLTPTMHIKNGKVAINKLISSGSYLTYALEVNGDVSATNFRGALVGNADTATTATNIKYVHTDEINFKGGTPTQCLINYRSADTDAAAAVSSMTYKFMNYSNDTSKSKIVAGTFSGNTGDITTINATSVSASLIDIVNGSTSLISLGKVSASGTYSGRLTVGSNITLSGADGKITCVSLTQTSGSIISSRRVKTNIKPIEDSEKILELQAVSYDFKEKTWGLDCRGFIAEDVQEVLPNLVVAEQGNIPTSLDYISMIPYLQDVVKKQDQRIKTLEDTISQLSARLDALENN